MRIELYFQVNINTTSKNHFVKSGKMKIVEDCKKKN